MKTAKPWITRQHLDYEAVGVPTWKVFWKFATYDNDYRRSLKDGRARLLTKIRSITGSECGTTTQILLAGFSQGAQVVGDVYQDDLTASERRQVVGIALIGDPRFRGAEDSPPNVGTYDRRFNGAWDTLRTPRRLTTADAKKIRSYCIAGDPVCNLIAINLARCQVGGCVHSRYASEKYHGGDRYTRMAATWLMRRVSDPPTEPPPQYEVDPRCTVVDNRPRRADTPEWIGPLRYQLTGVWDAPPVDVLGSFRNRSASATTMIALSATVFPVVNAVEACPQYLKGAFTATWQNSPLGTSDHFDRKVGTAYSKMGVPESYTCFALVSLDSRSGVRSDYSAPLCFYRDGATAPPFVVDWDAVWRWNYPAS